MVRNPLHAEEVRARRRSPGLLPARPSDPRWPHLLDLSPLEFLEALSRLIPPPRVHRHRYHGVLAPNAGLRARVVALGRDDDTDAPEAPGSEAAPTHGHHTPTLTGAAARSRWARLLARIYEVFPLRCPECGADMRILAFLTDPEPVGAILSPLDRPHTPPRFSPARGPPQPAFHLDPEPVAPVDALPAVDDFDQTPTFEPGPPRDACIAWGRVPPSPSPSPTSTSIRPATPDGAAASARCAAEPCRTRTPRQQPSARPLPLLPAQILFEKPESSQAPVQSLKSDPDIGMCLA